LTTENASNKLEIAKSKNETAAEIAKCIAENQQKIRAMEQAFDQRIARHEKQV